MLAQALEDRQYFFSVLLKQLIVLAKIRALVVLPTPREPQNKKACAKCVDTYRRYRETKRSSMYAYAHGALNPRLGRGSVLT